MRNINEKFEQTVLNTKIQRRYPEDEVWGKSTTEVARKRKASVRWKRGKSLGNLNLKISIHPTHDPSVILQA